MRKVCISSCGGALDWSTSPLECLSRLLSLPRRAETSVHAHICGGFPTVSCGSCHTGQRAHHCACIGHLCWSDYLGPSSPSPRPISQYCSAQTSQVWNFDWKQRAPVLNAQQTRPRSCSCLLPLCSRWTSPLPTSSMALGWEVVHACHPMTQPPLQEGWGLNFGFFQLQRELNRGLPLVGWTLEMLSPAPFLPSVTLMDSDTDHDNDY